MFASAVAACSVGAGVAPSPSPGTPPPSAAPGYVAPEEAATLIGRCAVYGSIQAYFRIPSGSTFWTIFPKAGKAPELDGVEQLFVVVYRDPVTIHAVMGGNPAASPETPTQVVCVITPIGETNIYSGVSREGLNLPPGAHLGLPDASPSA
jgi:hypothetical protein